MSTLSQIYIYFCIISGCVDCVGEGRATHSRFSMPLAKLGEKKYYLGIFFKVSIEIEMKTLSVITNLNHLS